MLFQCPKCNQIDFDSSCVECSTQKDLYATADEIVVTISEPNSLATKNNHTSYLLRQEDLAIPIEQLKSFLDDTVPHCVSMRGVFIHGKTDEQKVWSATPHPLVIMLVVFQWIPGIISAVFLLTIFKSHWIWMPLLLFVAFLHILLNAIAIRFIRYRISSQRVEITDGLLHQQIRTYEVHHLGDATIDIPWTLGLFGLSMLTMQHRYANIENQLPLVRIFGRLPNNQIPSSITLIGLPTKEARLIRDILPYGNYAILVNLKELDLTSFG